MQMITPEEYIAAARKLIGVPFVRHGRTASELDCAGLLLKAAADAGMCVKDCAPGWRDVLTYKLEDDPRILQNMQRFCQPAPALVPASVLLFRFPAASRPHHFAIYCGTYRNGGEVLHTMIHADMGQRKIVEHGYRGNWIKRTHSRWLLPGIDYSAHLTVPEPA